MSRFFLWQLAFVIIYLIVMTEHENDIEIEIKLKLTSYAEYLKLVGYLGQMDHEEHLVNSFFDTPEKALWKTGWAYRVRVTNDTGLVTLKGKATVSGSAAIRPEIQEQINRSLASSIVADRHDPLDLECRPTDYVKTKLGISSLIKTVHFEILRQVKHQTINDQKYTFEIDTTSFADGTSDYELEIELSDESQIETAERDLARLFGRLNIPFEVQSESKYARALANRLALEE